MTTMIEPDTRGIDTLSGKQGDTVAQLPAVIWEQIMAELGPLPEAPTIDPFDDEPWLKLPTLEDLEKLWLESPLNTALHRLAAAAHGEGPDLMQYMAVQRQLADWEYKWRQVRCDEGAGADDVGAAGGVACVASADASGGGVDFSGGPEDSDAVGEGGEVAVAADAGKASKVQGKRRVGKAQGR